MNRRYFLMIILCLVILTPVFAVNEGREFREGSRVFINESSFFLSADPETVTGQGWVEVTLNSRQYTGGLLVGIMSDSSALHFSTPQRETNHYEDVLKSYYCNGNLVVNRPDKTFECFDNSSVIFSHNFSAVNRNTNTAYWYENEQVRWSDVPRTPKTFTNSRRTITYLDSIDFVAGQPSTFRFFLQPPDQSEINLLYNYNPKYDIFAYPSFYGATASGMRLAMAAGQFFLLDPTAEPGAVYIEDNFDDNSINATLWPTTTNVAETGGAMKFTGTGSPFYYPNIRTGANPDLRGDAETSLYRFYAQCKVETDNKGFCDFGLFNDGTGRGAGSSYPNGGIRILWNENVAPDTFSIYVEQVSGSAQTLCTSAGDLSAGTFYPIEMWFNNSHIINATFNSNNITTCALQRYDNTSQWPVNNGTYFSVVTYEGSTSRISYVDDYFFEKITVAESNVTITQNSYNLASGIDSGNQTIWQTNTSYRATINESSPTLIFDTNILSVCAISVDNQNLSTMLDNNGVLCDENSDNSTSIEHTCTLGTELSALANSDIYVACAQEDSGYVDNGFASDSGALPVYVQLYTIIGSVLDEDSVAVVNATVYLQKLFEYSSWAQTSTNSSGGYTFSVDELGIYFVSSYSPLNYSQKPDAQFINVTG